MNRIFKRILFLGIIFFLMIVPVFAESQTKIDGIINIATLDISVNYDKGDVINNTSFPLRIGFINIRERNKNNELINLGIIKGNGFATYKISEQYNFILDVKMTE